MVMLTKLNQTGKTIIMVTHENDIAAWARRVVRMRDGLIESDVRNAPRPNPLLPPVVSEAIQPALEAPTP
jgi:ABC-type lipoprotein export system ATPase subunit